MIKFFDLLFNFKVKKEEMISKSIIWGILAFGICYAIANVL
jgi:hypothetical protein